jgi:integrase
MTVRRIKKHGQKSYMVDLTLKGGGRMRRSDIRWTREDAQEEERRILDRDRNPPPAPAKEVPLLKDFMKDRYLPLCKGTNRASTVDEKESAMRLWLVPQLGDRRLDQIGYESVSTLYAEMASAELSEKSRKNVGGILRHVLQFAVDAGELEKLPRLPKIKVPDAEWDYFTREETSTLLAAIKDPEHYAEILFAFRTGARSGEQTALEWGDIDWVNRFVVFRRARSRGQVGPTKSGKGRHVPLTPQLADALKAIKHLKSDLVFCNPDGTPKSEWQLHRLLARYCRLAGLRTIKRHEARHSFASQAVMAGVPIARVQQWLGHSTIMMTMRYAHLAPADGGDLTAALDGTDRRVWHHQGTGAASIS